MPVYFPCLLDTAVLTHPVQGTCAGKHVESPNISITDTTPPNTDKSGKCDVSSAIGDFYRLHSVLLHTGTANGGHYKAYVLDSLSGHWLECNDASVSEMTTIEEASLFLQKESISCSMLCSPSPENLKNHTDGVVEARNMRDDRNMGLGAPAHGENEILPAAVEPTVESSKSDRECIGGRIRQRKFALLSDDVLRENAYMLLYHKISKDCMKEVSKNVENDEEIKYSSCGERKEAMMLREACLAAIPMPLQMEINSKNKELMELRSLYEMQKKVLTVKVLYNYSVVEAIKKQYLMERTGGTGLPSVRSSTSTERVLNNEVKIRNGNTKGKIQLQHMTVAVLITDTMDSLLDQICSLLDIYTTATSSTTTEEGVKADQKVIVSIDTEEGTSIHSRKYFHRLRAFDPVSGQDGETFGSRGAESFEKLGFRVCHTNGSAAQPCVTLKFESRREDHPIFSEMKKNDLCLNVIVWSTEVSAAYTICYEANKSHPYSAHDQVISKNHSPWKNHTGSVSDDNIIIDANDDYDYNTNAPESEGYKAINPDQTGEHHTTDSLHESEAVLTAATRNVLVPGELNATLGELRATVAKLLNILESDLILIFNDGRSHSELENGRDSQTLGRAFGIKKGDIVFAEIKIKPSIIDENIVCSSGDCMLPSDITHAPLSVEYVSEALTYLRYLSTSMTIKFNDPRIHKVRSNSNSILKGTGMIVHSNVTETEESIPNEYLTLKTSSDTLLKDVKIMIADILGIPLPRNSQNVVRGVEKEEFEEEGTSDFYMAKSSSAFASQYNDFSRSLSDLGLFDQSVIYLQVIDSPNVSSLLCTYMYCMCTLLCLLRNCHHFIVFIFINKPYHHFSLN